jgi:sec-independent protein translocase protein TatA
MFLFGPVGLPELLLILLIVVIIFGARRLPELGKGLGEGIRNFKRGLGGKDSEDKKTGSGKDNSSSKE